jgi:hypothetical protein
MTNLSTLFTNSQSSTRVNNTTTPVTLLASDCTGFKTFTNTGATEAITMLLPAGSDGLKIQAIVTAAYDFIFTANGIEKIGTGSSIKSSTIGDILTLTWTGTNWAHTGFTYIDSAFINDSFVYSMLLGG